MTACHYPLSTKTAQPHLGRETTDHAVLTYQPMSHQVRTLPSLGHLSTPSFLSVNLAQTPASLLAILWLSPPGQVIQGVCLPCILSKPCVLPSRISLAAI